MVRLLFGEGAECFQPRNGAGIGGRIWKITLRALTLRISGTTAIMRKRSTLERHNGGILAPGFCGGLAEKAEERGSYLQA